MYFNLKAIYAYISEVEFSVYGIKTLKEHALQVIR